MGAVIDRFAAAGIRFDLLAGDRILARGNLTDDLRAAISTHKPAIIAELAAGARHFRWRIDLPNRAPFEVRVLPESTSDEMRAQYPGARFEPMPERAGRVATNAESDELRALIEGALADAPDEWDEAHRLGCADIEDALLGWRSCLSE